jgi:hypothetical protein
VDVAENAEKLEGKTLDEIYADIPESITVTDSTTNGNILVNDVEIQVYDDSDVLMKNNDLDEEIADIIPLDADLLNGQLPSYYATKTSVDGLGGTGRTTETVKGNADALVAHLADLTTDVDGAHGLKIEEGTWSPTLFGQTTAGNNSYSTQSGRYIKIGKNVTCNAYITMSAKDANMTGNVKFGGLPFVVVSTSHGSSSFGYIRNISVPEYSLQMVAYPVNSTTRCDIGFVMDSGVYNSFAPTHVQNTTSFIFSVEYLTN